MSENLCIMCPVETPVVRHLKFSSNRNLRLRFLLTDQPGDPVLHSASRYFTMDAHARDKNGDHGVPLPKLEYRSNLGPAAHQSGGRRIGSVRTLSSYFNLAYSGSAGTEYSIGYETDLSGYVTQYDPHIFSKYLGKFRIKLENTFIVGVDLLCF
jgi:hypothetical protein